MQADIHVETIRTTAVTLQVFIEAIFTTGLVDIIDSRGEEGLGLDMSQWGDLVDMRLASNVVDRWNASFETD